MKWKNGRELGHAVVAALKSKSLQGVDDEDAADWVVRKFLRDTHSTASVDMVQEAARVVERSGA